MRDKKRGQKEREKTFNLEHTEELIYLAQSGENKSAPARDYRITHEILYQYLQA